MRLPQLRLPGLGGEAGRWLLAIQTWADVVQREVSSSVASILSRLTAVEYSAANRVRALNVNLTSGVADVADPLIVAGSMIALARHTQVGTISSTVEYDVSAISPGVGFTVRARTSTGATATGDSSDLYAIVVNP